MKNKKIVVVGLGYIGLPTAIAFAQAGFKVIGVDAQEEIVTQLNLGVSHIDEPGVQDSLSKFIQTKQISVTSEMPRGACYVVAVPTPINDDKSANLAYVQAAIAEIAPVLVGNELVIIESTCPPGTTRAMGEYLLTLRPDLNIGIDYIDSRTVHIVHCPERVLPGRILQELSSNSRIVGGLTSQASEIAANLYSYITSGSIEVTDSITAELTKLVENSFRDVNIAFANELSEIANMLKVDVWELIRLANQHPRVSILNPGPGVGGHCIAVDPWFIVDSVPDQSRLIKTARLINDDMPSKVLERIRSLDRSGDFRELTFFGLTFKPNVADLRESPALEVVKRAALEFPDRRIFVVDPHIERLPDSLIMKNVIHIDLDELQKLNPILSVVLVGHVLFMEKEVISWIKSGRSIDVVGIFSTEKVGSTS